MAGIAVIAQEMGFRVSGSDKNLYPPMSTQLEKLGIALHEGYEATTINLKPDLWIVGNGISRGNPLLEVILESDQPYTSAPQWLYENVLRKRHVIAIAGTHGKTTTTSMTTFMLDHVAQSKTLANIQGQCGYLIGGVAQDFPFSARWGNNRFFVIEADEYDTAFFDKRSKFVHYHPRTLIFNNLEFDHADIFPNLAAIETQCHHMVRTLSRSAHIIANFASESLHRVRTLGCYSNWQWFNDPAGWHINQHHINDGAQKTMAIPKNIIGDHNRNNALAGVLALQHVGIPISASLEALASFKGVRRRLECRGIIPTSSGNITVYDDFAHHPTAIHETLRALNEKLLQDKNLSNTSSGKIIAVIEPRSNTMKMGIFSASLAESLQNASYVVGYNKGLGWDLAGALSSINAQVFDDIDHLVAHVASIAQGGDTIIGMSNGSFDAFHERLITQLTSNYSPRH